MKTHPQRNNLKSTSPHLRCDARPCSVPRGHDDDPVLVTAEQEWPGEPVDNHVHMTWAALTMEVGDWSKENPEIVNLLDVGKSELGKSSGWFSCPIGQWKPNPMGARKKSFTSMEDTMAMSIWVLHSRGCQQNGTSTGGLKEMKKDSSFAKLRSTHLDYAQPRWE